MALEFLERGGAMGAEMRRLDWLATPLGAPATWPQSLCTSVSTCLSSRFPILIWWGPDLLMLYNDAYRSLLGAKHPALGRPGRQVWPEIWDIIGPMLNGVLERGEATWSEQQMLAIMRHGFTEESYFTFSYSPILGDNGAIAGVFTAVSEVTQQVLSERRLELLRLVGESMTGAQTVGAACDRAANTLTRGISDIPFALIYQQLDTGVLRLAGCHGLAANSEVAPYEASADCALWSLGEVLETRREKVLDVSGRGLPGGPWPEPTRNVIVQPIEVAGATLVLVTGTSPRLELDDKTLNFHRVLAGHIGSGIAAARAHENERARIESLAELDKAKTAFFSNISHEFRTPLTLMLGQTEDALESPSHSLSGDALRSVHNNELRLLKLVNALLEFSRIEAGRVHAKFVATDICTLTEGLTSLFRSAIESAGLEFDVRCATQLPPIELDREMWEKIVLNLLSNALKFTFEGKITVEVRERENWIELSVADTGIGVADADLPHLFERFHRIEGARARTHEGSGIGLALTAELVKLLDGVIEVQSEVGRGTRFTVHIPRRVSPGAEVTDSTVRFSSLGPAFVEEATRWLPNDPSTNTADDRLYDENLPEESARILVADDNADIRAYLTRLLRPRWQVIAVSDGVQALQMARRAPPDLVLTDVMMPNLDGVGLLRELRADPVLANVPVIMLSARAGEEARVDGIEAGADDYLIKPFSARELVARVSNLLQLARLRRELERERNRLASFVEQSPVGVALWEGPDLRCSVVNEAYAKIAHRPIVRGMSAAELFPEIVGTEAMRRLESVLREGDEIDIAESEVALELPDGSIHEGFYNVSYRPLRSPDGTVHGVIQVVVEVTEQVRAREIIEANRREAVLANRAKDEFLAMLGHELRNPLAPIQTALELMKMRGEETFERERAVIERQTQHLAGLLDDLLDVARITRGTVELKREPLRLSEILARAVETAAPLFEQQHHELTTDVPSDLVIVGDAARLTQVFSNLLTNAAKYTDRAGRVRVTAYRDGDDVVARVTDTGRGISPDVLPHVFELFVQERENVARSRGGLGLGLAIVQNLVRLHGGTVTAESEGPGKGTTFCVRLPAPREAITLPVPAEPQDTLERRRSDASILVVDDNVDAATLLADVLVMRGYDVQVAHDGPEALELAEHFVPTVAVIDIGLPAMDGYQLAKRLREMPQWQHVKLVALTGYGQRDDRNKSAEAGFDVHLVKPIDMATLERVLPPRPEPPRAQSTARLV